MQLFQLKEQMREAGILASFAGSFNHVVLEELAASVKKYLENAELGTSMMMDVFSVYIETAQNVRNYTERQRARGVVSADLDSSIVAIAQIGTEFHIHSGNIVDAADLDDLLAQLQRLAGLDKAGLKAAFKEQLRRERGASEVGKGAGLGLIEMARRASKPLIYDLTPTGDGKTFFSLCVVI